jgi:spore coat protein H
MLVNAQLQGVAAFEPGAFPGADLFTNGAPINLRIQITDSNLEVLRKESREFVAVEVTDRQTVFSNVAVHLKSSIGSFRPVDDKASWTLDFSRFNPSQKFHGLRRIHLNNSVEDPSYCNELLGSELFRAAGVPTPRVTRAVVTLNNRRLGLYVLKEGFTEDFLSCYFSHPSGNLYEPDEGHDINQRLKRNSIQAPRSDRTALRALADTVRDPDNVRRWERLEKALAIEEFVSFMAMEVMLGHRDGYCLARNNFRIYEDADAHKFWFFPQGMDQLWRNPDAPWRPQMAGLVARAVVETPEGKIRYRALIGDLVTNLLRPDFLGRRIDELTTELRPSSEGDEFAGIQREAASVKERIKQRRTSLDSQLCQTELKLVTFDQGPVVLQGWKVFDPPAKGSMEVCKTPDGITALHIQTGTETATSWRTRVLLNRGQYRFEGRASVSGVKLLPFGVHQGAGLRVGGSTRQSENLAGNTLWRPLQAEFRIETDNTVAELICELRASAGEAWFDSASLKIIRLQ